MQIQSSNICDLSANSITSTSANITTLTAGGGSKVGDVTFNSIIGVKSTSIDRAITPSSNEHKYFDFLDKNGLRLGVIGGVMRTDGYWGTYLQGGNECGIGCGSNGTSTKAWISASTTSMNALTCTSIAASGAITQKGYSVPYIIETKSGSNHSSGGLAHKWTYMVTQTPLGKLYEEWGFSDYLTYNDNTNYYLYFQKTLKSYSDGTASITHGQYGASDCAAFDCTFDNTTRAAIRQHRYSNGSDSYRFTYYLRGLIN